MPCTSNPNCVFALNDCQHHCSTCKGPVHNLCAQKIPGTAPPELHYCSIRCSGHQEEHHAAAPSNIKPSTLQTAIETSSTQPEPAERPPMIPKGSESSRRRRTDRCTGSILKPQTTKSPSTKVSYDITSPIRKFFGKKSDKQSTAAGSGSTTRHVPGEESVELLESPPQADQADQADHQPDDGNEIQPSSAERSITEPVSSEPERRSGRRSQIVATIAERQKVRQWMITELQNNAENIPSRALQEFLVYSTHTIHYHALRP